MIDDKISSPEQESKNGIQIVEILSVLWQRRKLIALVTGVATILGIIYSLLLPLKFTSTATILPDADKSKMPGGLSDLALLAGVSVGGDANLTKLYPVIIKSEAVLRPVIYHKFYSTQKNDSLDLIGLWELKDEKAELNYQQAYLVLCKALDVAMDTKTQIITLKFEGAEPQLTADVINQVIKELDRFIRTKRNTTASEQRKFIESRLAEVKQDLSKSEDRLKEFREKNRVIISSPQLMLEQERYIRDVSINSALYTELRKQYELIKIEEVKNVPIINVMDRATAAARKSSPKRSMMVLAFLFLGGVGAAGYVIFNKYGRSNLTRFVSSIRQQRP